MARHALDVDFRVRSGVEDGLYVVENLKGEMLIWSRLRFGTSLYGSLVVDKYPDTISAGVHRYPFSGMCRRLQHSKQLCIINFDMFSQVPQSLRVWVLFMDCNQTSTIGSCSSL